MTPRKLLRVARWEATKGVASVDRRTAAALAAIVLVTLAAVPALAATGLALDDGIYRVGIAPDHPLHGPVANDSSFAVRDPSREAFENGEIEILIDGNRARYRDTEKGRAAVAELGRAVERYNDRRMASESNRTAAYPAAVTLRFVERGSAVTDAGDGGTGTDGDGNNGGGG
ncbi:PrsW family intramembrane metalloprotease, partial [Halobacteriales archaeon QS_9_67_17]